MKKYSRIALFLLSFCIVSGPYIAFGAAGGAGGPTTSGIVPCTDNCDFSYLMIMGQRIMNFLLIIAAICAALLFAYAGFLYVFAAGNEGSIKKAHRLFFDAGIGLVFMGGAWLLVEIILQTLGYGRPLGTI